MRKHLTSALLVAYVILSIITFGRAWVNASEPRSPYVSKIENSSYTAFGAAVFWPLYWSIVAWEKP